MIAILLNGTYLDTFDTNLRWETVNTLFEEDALQSDYSFPFTLPLSAINKNAFGFINDPSVIKSTKKFDVILQVAEKQLQSRLIVQGISKNKIKVSIAGGLSGIFGENERLRDVNFNDGQPIVIADLTSLFDFAEADYKNIIAFPPHYNPNFYGDKNPDFQGVINRQNTNDSSYPENTIITGSKYALVPFVYIAYLLKSIFELKNYTVSGNFFEVVDFTNLLLYNNRALDKPSSGTTSCYVLFNGPQVINGSDPDTILKLSDTLPGASDTDSIFASNKITIAAPGDYSFDFNIAARGISIPHKSNPYVEVKLIKNDGVETVLARATDFGINQTLSISLQAPLLAGDEVYIYVNLIYSFATSPVYEITSASLSCGLTNPTVFNGMDNEVFITNHLPDIGVIEFLNEVKKLLQLDFKIDDTAKTVKLELAEKIITGLPEADFTPLTDPYPEQILDEDKGYTVEYDFGSNDELVSDNFKPFNKDKIVGEYGSIISGMPLPGYLGDLAIVKSDCKLYEVQDILGVLTWVKFSDYYYPLVVGKGERKISIKLAPMFMTNDATLEGSLTYAQMPHILELGNSPMFGIGENNPMSLRTVFMRGAWNHAPGYHVRVYATASNWTYLNSPLGEYTLLLTGNDGMHEKWYKKLFEAIDASEVFEYKISLAFSELKYRGKVQIKNINYLVKDISTPVGKTIKQSLARLLKLPI